MVSSISYSSTQSASQLANYFSKLDTDGSSSISKPEFVAGKPSDVSDDQAGTLYDLLDSSGSGALSQNDLLSAFQQLAGQMQSTLIQAQGGHGGHGGPGGPGGPPPDSDQMFTDLDTDGDGTVTRAEFVAGRPDDVSEEQASAFFDKVSGDNGESLTEAQLAEGLKNAGPPEQSGAASKTSETDTGDSQAQDYVAQILNQIMQAISSYQTTASRYSQTQQASVLGATSVSA